MSRWHNWSRFYRARPILLLLPSSSPHLVVLETWREKSRRLEALRLTEELSNQHHVMKGISANQSESEEDAVFV